MDFDDFRLRMADTRQRARMAVRSLDDPDYVPGRMRSYFGSLDDRDRRLAARVLAAWALSDDEGLRSDALSVISAFRVSSVMPALQRLSERLRMSGAPGAGEEEARVQALIRDLDPESP